MTATDERLAAYRALLAKVDAKFADIHDRHRPDMACGAGCHACCAPDLTVSLVEKSSIAEHIRTTPGLPEHLAALDSDRPHGAVRCRFLDADGCCAIYAVRPVICRSHGAPTRVPPSPTRTSGHLSVCSLNFCDGALDRLPAGDCIDVETLNTLLFVIGRRFDGQDDGTRYPLTVQGILGDALD